MFPAIKIFFHDHVVFLYNDSTFKITYRLKIHWFLLLLILFYKQDLLAQDVLPEQRLHIDTWPYNLKLNDSIIIEEYVEDKIKPLTSSNDSLIPLLQYIISQSKIIEYKYGVAKGQQLLGMYYSHTGRLSQAITLFKSALETCRNQPELSFLLHSIYNNLGVAYYSLGFNAQAAEYYFKAIGTIGKDKGSVSSIINRYNNLSTVLPDKKQALEYLDKAYNIADSVKNYRQMGIVLQNKSSLYEYLKEHTNAHNAISEAYNIGVVHDDYFLQYMSLIRWGYNYYNLRQFHKALASVLKAQELLPKVPEMNAFHGNAHRILIGEIYINLKNFGAAEKHLLATLDTAKKYGMKEQELNIYQSLFQLYRQKGALEKAINFQSSYLVLKDSLLNEKIAQGINLMEVEHRVSENEKVLMQKEKEVQKRNYQITGISAMVVVMSILLFALYRNMRQKQKAFKSEKEISILKAVIQGEEAERSRIAGELHDGIMVNFSTLKMSLSAVWRSMEKNTEHHKEIGELLSRFEGATKELRRSAHNLMPELLLREGLAGALQYFCSNSQQVVPIEFQQYGELPPIPAQYQLMLYRIVQELVQNALKYARADHILVQLDITDDYLAITVEDNGIGFDFSPGDTRKHMGLHKIRSRIVSLGGDMSVKTAKGKGTSIYIEIALNNLKVT